MPRTRRVVAGAVALGLLGVVIVGTLAGGAGGVADGPTPAAEAPETDNTVTRIQVRPDGSARWTVRIRTRLATDDEVAAYEAFQERFRANRSAYREAFRTPMARIVATASNETGRPMATTNVTASTELRTVPRRWGVVTYAFTWDGFANQSADRLAVGDAFQSGFFIAQNDTLQLVAPEGYELRSVEPSPDERSEGTAGWVGRVDFGTAQPAATMVPADPESGGLSPFVLGAAVLLVILAVAGAWYWRRGETERATEPAGPVGGPDTEASAVAGGTEVPEPIADDERVRQLLSAHGGRMRQADIVEEVDWSKSKVSRLVADLADRGLVEKTRLGRENVVELVDESEAGEDSTDAD